MKNLVKDIEENCDDCECNTEATIKFLMNSGDLSFTSDHYREVWYFYKELAISLKNKKQARETTLELFKISHEKFRHIRKWWNSNHKGV